jgi:hypothetical protein
MLNQERDFLLVADAFGHLVGYLGKAIFSLALNKENTSLLYSYWKNGELSVYLKRRLKPATTTMTVTKTNVAAPFRVRIIAQAKACGYNHDGHKDQCSRTL